MVLPRRPGLRVSLTVCVLALLPATAAAAPWNPDPNRTLPAVADLTQKLELVDIDADGFVDLVFANSRGDSTGSDADAQLNQLVRNDQGSAFVDVPGVFDEPDNAYVIKAGDLDRNGRPDLVVGVNFGGQSYVLLHDGGAFTRQDIVPGAASSIGDLDLGDLDGDGDLDVLAADWGSSQPFGDPLDPGGPVRLWLGDGFGGFSDGQAQLPMGMESLVAWSFDLELLDLDNDLDLDAAIASRGPGHALVLVNDGAGNFAVHPVPSLQPANKKLVNSAFTVVDLNADLVLDLVTLQDGPAGANTVLVGLGGGAFTDNLGAYWALVDNPPRLDFDAASLDFDNDGTPDLVVTGLRQNPGEVNTRLMLNDGVSLEPVPPDGAAFPLLPELDHSFGVLLADLDGDRRDDAVVAVRDELAPNAVLFGGPDVPEDITPPRIDLHDLVPALVAEGQQVQIRARVHDAKIPARWHDFFHDPQLDTYNLAPGTANAHRRRLPYLELAVGLADPAQLETLADDDPEKLIVPGEWSGGAQWRMTFLVPPPQQRAEFLAYRLCAIDAAGNKICTPTFTAEYGPPPGCGDGVVQPWEECDDAVDPLCLSCTLTCGNALCERHENSNSCPADCGELDGNLPPCGDGFCDSPVESAVNCPEDCPCGDGVCDPWETSDNCPEDCHICGDGICGGDEWSSGACPEDCGFCGDCICQPSEHPQTCPEDCGTSWCDDPTGGYFCGDGICSYWEEQVCVEDCPIQCLDGCDDGPFMDSVIVDDDSTCGCRGVPSGDLLGLLLALLARRRRRMSL